MEVEAIGMMRIDDQRGDPALGIARREGGSGEVAQMMRLQRVLRLTEVVHVDLALCEYIHVIL